MASNTGGHFAVIHLNDTARQGGHGYLWFGSESCGGAWFCKVCFGQAVMARSGKLRYVEAWFGAV
ncbi:MAG: hypothetical protein ACPGR4_04755 [Paracoccaceae bacterium]